MGREFCYSLYITDFSPFHDIFDALQYFPPKFSHSDNLACRQSKYRIHQMMEIFCSPTQVEHARQETAGSNEIPSFHGSSIRVNGSSDRIYSESTGTCHNRQLYTVTGSLHRVLTIFRRGSCQILHVSSRFSREMHGNTAARKH